MPVRCGLVGMGKAKECGLVERPSAELDANGEDRRTSGEATRKNDGRDTHHVGEVEDIRAPWRWRVRGNIRIDDLLIEPGSGIAGG